MYNDSPSPSTVAKFCAIGAAIILVLVVLFAAGCPAYNVWQKEMKGKAALAEAENARQVTVEQAKADLEAEKLNAQSEIARAQGAAEAIEIEGGNLTETYIKYLWVRQQGSLSEADKVYIPTEAGLPILEARK